MLSRRIVFGACALGLLAVAAPVFAQGARCAPAPCAPASCQPACDPAPQMVEQTVMCPTWVTENRVVTRTACRPETRTATCTVYQLVPETHAVQRQCTVMVPETRTRVENYTVCKPVWKDVQQEYCVQVPYTETRQGTRTVCRMVPETQTVTVCEDQGHWEARCCLDRFCCPRTYCVWVPNIVQKQVQVTCMKPQITQEPCTYEVTLCRTEKRTCTVKVCETQSVQMSRTVPYTVCVPQVKTWTENVTTCRSVPVQQTYSYSVMVPYQYQETVQVQVCQMVPKKVQVPVCPTSCCKPCCDSWFGCRRARGC